jgi:hypothetical protein
VARLHWTQLPAALHTSSPASGFQSVPLMHSTQLPVPLQS